MFFESFVSRRYISGARRSGALKLITVISVVGMALGVAALISVLSVMDGFLSEMKKNILSSTAHAHFYKLVGRFEEWDEKAKQIRNIEGVAGVTPIVSGEVMVAANRVVVGGISNGIDPDTIGSVVELPRQMEKNTKGGLHCLKGLDACPELGPKTVAEDDDITAAPAEELKPVLLGRDMAKRLKVSLGDIVTIISPLGGGLGPSGPVPISRNFRVAGLFYTGMYEYDTKFIYMGLADAQQFFSLPQSVTYLSVKVHDIYRVKETANRIMQLVDGFPYSIQDWMAMNKTTFKFLSMQKAIMFIILIFIVLVASFGIVSTLIMLVMGKIHEIAILKAMGARSGQVMRLFMLDGLFVGIAGTVSGMLLAVIVCTLLKGIEFPLAKDIYFFNHLPVEMSAVTFSIVSVCALLISLLATLYPSWQAARIRPAEGLRYD